MLRTQMVSSRTAHGSVSGTIAIAMVRSTRRAVVSGTMPMPTLHSTIRHTASKLRNCTRNRSGRPMRTALLERKRCKRAGAIEANEVVVEHIFKADFRTLGQRVIARDHEHEAVAAKRVGFEPACIDGAGDDAEVGDAFGDQADDLVAQALFQIDADVRMLRQERAERFGQEFGQRIGIGQHADLPGEPAPIGAEILMQPLGLAQNGAGVLQQCAAGLRGRHARPSARQQRDAKRILHVADAGRSSRQRQMRALGAVCDASRLNHMAKQAQISQIETHGRALPSDFAK